LSRTKLGAVLALVAAFVLGAVAGAYGMRGQMLRGFTQRMAGPPGRARMEFRIEAMSRTLGLTPEQRQKIDQIMTAHEEERRQLMERCAPDGQSLREKVDAEIRAVLTPEQQKKFDALPRRQHRRGGPPRGPFPP